MSMRNLVVAMLIQLCTYFFDGKLSSGAGKCRSHAPERCIAAVREHGDMLCLLDYSGNIDPGPGECFPRPGSRLVNLVLLVNCVPDLGKCLLEPGVLPNEPGFVINYFNPGT